MDKHLLLIWVWIFVLTAQQLLTSVSTHSPPRDIILIFHRIVFIQLIKHDIKNYVNTLNFCTLLIPNAAAGRRFAYLMGGGRKHMWEPSSRMPLYAGASLWFNYNSSIEKLWFRVISSPSPNTTLMAEKIRSSTSSETLSNKTASMNRLRNVIAGKSK